MCPVRVDDRAQSNVGRENGVRVIDEPRHGVLTGSDDGDVDLIAWLTHERERKESVGGERGDAAPRLAIADRSDPTHGPLRERVVSRNLRLAGPAGGAAGPREKPADPERRHVRSQDSQIFHGHSSLWTRLRRYACTTHATA